MMSKINSLKINKEKEEKAHLSCIMKKKMMKSNKNNYKI